MPIQAVRLIESQDAAKWQAQLQAELDTCTEVHETYRNKVKKFMLAYGIPHIAELDYEWREAYADFLKTEVKPVCYSTYLKAFDRIKRHSMQRSMTIAVKGKTLPPPYTNTVLFLPYHPNEKIANMVFNAGNKQDLVWDFSRKAPETMKRQIYEVLHYVLENAKGNKQLRLYIKSLQKLYDFCTAEQIEDIEQLTRTQIDRFKATLEAPQGKESAIIGLCCKALFLQAEEIHWNANVWYMERIHLAPERIDPSKPVKSLSFAEVEHTENRRLLKKYMRYGLGITNLSINNLRQEMNEVRGFLAGLKQTESENVCMLTPEQMDAYFKEEQQRAVQTQTYNNKVMCLLHFFSYLKVRGYIERIPFDEECYLKKSVTQHHNRSVSQEVTEEILSKLYRFPEEIRLMYLHLWGIGLRISEVCTLKGDAYYIQGEDAWIQVYQIKMKTYKRIPIPAALYKLMLVYLKKHRIKAEDYVFQNTKGGAYHSCTFRKKMLKACAENNIQGGEYLFKSHDYRHTIATHFYDTGVPIQSIRDYLGHDYEEMTLQYIDYMPKKIEKASEEYFSRHSLADCLEMEVDTDGE